MSETPSQSPEPAGRNFPRFFAGKGKMIVGIAAAVAVVILLVYTLQGGPVSRGTPQGGLEEVYALVRDKVSKSAAVPITLPKGVSVTVEEAPTKITFDPPLEGSWAVGGAPSELFFAPKKKLEQGNHYTVALQTPDGVLSKDFLVDEDPHILSIFPRADSEASEYSEITIVFNRPMVPLTTLDAQDERDIPVEITPKTEGRFKWITTRNLQFIPTTHLVRSSNYTVKIKQGFVSMDGLAVAGREHRFTTRPLRYESESTVGQVPHTLAHQPILVRFNQPVDLERTKAAMTVKIGDSRSLSVPVTAEYGTRTVYDEKSRKDETYLDKSVLAVYGAKDRFGREKFWDFETSYLLSIAKAFPLEGDIVLDESRMIIFSVPEVLASVSAESERSRHVAADLFDPQGRLIVTFSEEMDKDASSIKAPHLQKLAYGEQCKENEYGYRPNNSDCDKEPDKTRFVLTFDASAFGKGESIPVEFRKLVNTAGISLLADTLTRTAVTYPELRITKLDPPSGAKDAKLTDLTFCSNTPLREPPEEDFYTKTLKSNISVGRWNWNESYRAQPSSYYQGPCAVGEFHTTLRYGLIPESQYEMRLFLTDDFGATAQPKITLESGSIDAMYRRLLPLQKAYNVTAPERTKLAFTAENLEYVNMNICQVDASTMLRSIDTESRPDVTTAGENLGCLQSISRRVELPKRYWNVNFFQINLSDYIPAPLGHYIVSLGHPDYRQYRYNSESRRYDYSGPLVYERTFLTVTNMAVQEKRIESGEWTQDESPEVTSSAQRAKGGNLYFVARIGTLAPVVGARVDLYRKDAWAGGGVTDAEGIARTPVVPQQTSAIVSYLGDSAIVSSQLDKFQWASALAAARKTYIYTDRPIYRPNEEVFIKGLFRIGYDGEYEIVKDRSAHIEVWNSRGESVHAEDAKLSEYGTFTAKLMLQKGAPLGTYRIEALGDYGYFDVEEYAPAAFAVDLSSQAEEYIAGEKLSLSVDANYYFGVPVEEGSEVSYSILAQDYHFDRHTDTSGGYFQFGRGWYYWGFNGYGDRFIARNKTLLNVDGKATIEEPLDFETFFKDAKEREQSKLLTVYVSVKNKEGQTISANKTFIVHRGAFYLGANLEKRFFGKNEPNKIVVKTVDTKGKPLGVGDIDASVSKVTWESFSRQEVDGRYYARSERKLTEVAKYNLRTDAEGNGAKEFTVAEDGEYELTAKSKDRDGNPVASVIDFYVYGTGRVDVRETNNETLELSVDRNRLKVGETADVVVKSPFERGKALVTLERGRIFEYEIVDVANGLIHLPVTMKAEYIPNIYLSVVLLSPRPEIKFGQVEFDIDAAEKELFVTVTSDKQQYLPGEKVRLSVVTKDASGAPTPAELSVSVADLSVLALAGNPKKNPVAFFYGGIPLGVVTASNVKNILYEAEVPKGTKGGGGGDAEDLARKKRGNFKSTAFWEGQVTTGADGRAEVTFTLPDNLTTWQSEIVGITEDTKVGAGYGEFMARKDVMAVPLRPRFIVPGDEFKLGAKIFNESGETLRFNVKAESPTLLLAGAKNAFIKVGPHESKTVYFDATAPESVDTGAHRFVISAEAGGYLDSVEDAIRITRNETYESVATAFSTTKDSAREYIFLPENVVKDRGALTVNTSATLSMYTSDALKYLVEYPYGCSEQLASKLSAIAVLKRSLEARNKGDTYTAMKVAYDGAAYAPDELVSIGLSRMLGNQDQSGGFAYYPNLRPSFYLTLHILQTLENLRRAGYAVDAAVTERASNYLQNEFRSEPHYQSDRDLTILLAYTLERLPWGAGKSTAFSGHIRSFANTRSFVREEASSISLAYLAMTLSSSDYSQALRDEVLGALENRLSVDGRGAFIRGGRRMFYDFYETPIKDTALLMSAWTTAKKDHPLSDKVLRWLMKSRSKDGSWGSTQNTLAVLDALSEYTKWKQEANSNFELTALLDQKELKKFTFTPANNEEVQSFKLPVSDIGFGALHTIEFAKKNLNTLPNTFYYDMSLSYFLPITSIAPRDEGFTVSRSLYRLDDTKGAFPVADAKQGEVLRAHLTVTVPKQRTLVAVESFIPAGIELINFKLKTEDQSLNGKEGGGYGFERPSRTLLGGVLGSKAELPDEAYGPPRRHDTLPVSAEESHDDRLFLFTETLSPGVYEYDYFVRALIPGKYQVLPAVVSELYFPENFGRTGGGYFTVAEQ